ncbi:nuclear transport factor 2 family protein [Azohydromonas sediminis]|uniref:nuclear transport factor 2 family protein n=1 Tax=Azohydromonas sediminis TaxID=2259674 RepID=UPI001F36066A|nr:nuclear transport factor 2 family protein [Azohydromonas sediminis]
MDAEQLAAAQACRDVVVASAHAVDARDFDAFAALFTDDAVLVRPNGDALHGRAAILAAYRQRDPARLTRHVIGSHAVELLDANTARSRCYVVVWGGNANDAPTPQGRPADATHMVGEFADELARTAAGWRIRRRDASFALFRR